MPRWFNTAGPCTPEDHYMIPPGRRLPLVRRVIDHKHYFVLHAPRQSGNQAAHAAPAHGSRDRQRLAGPVRQGPRRARRLVDRHRAGNRATHYAKVGVSYLWLADLDARVVTAHRLESGRWLALGVYSDETEARIEPFNVVPLDVASWWPPLPPKSQP